MEIVTLPLDGIRINGGTQPRVETNESAIAEYAEVIRFGGELPPVVVFDDGTERWLADGFHRFHAHRKAGAMEIQCDVRHGTKRDAILYSVGANAAHGLRRTNDDKRKAVMTLLQDGEWSKWTDVAVAKACGVSSHFVGDMRRIIDPINDSPVRNVERNGTTYQQDTANIGKIKVPSAKERSEHLEKFCAQEPMPKQIDEDAFGGFDPVAELETSHKENLALQEQIAALSNDDMSVTLAKEIQTRQGIEARLAQEMTKNAQLDKELRYFGKIMKELRDLLGVDSNSRIAGAVRAALVDKVA